LFGSFAFTNLAPEENYHFKVEAIDTTIKLPNMCKISLSDKNGTILKTLTGSPSGNFYFEILKTDTSTMLEHMKVDDTQLRLEMTRVLLNAQKVPMAHVIVSAIGKDGKLIQEAFSDSHGVFTLTDMPLDKGYYIQVDKLSDQLSNGKPVYFADENNTVIAELNTKNDYKYEVRAGDAKNMGGVYLDDPWLRALRLKSEEMKITENIYFDYQKWDVVPSAARILDKVILVMKHDLTINIELDAYTDSRGDDEFNIRLSQKRANAVMAYMAMNGIAANRMIGKGLGKANPLINCADPNIHCSEAEFAVNRRIEFKIRRVLSAH
ncbi:MAG TPA: OmpA family protein, partial [Bacteroidia bacterium]|nr:OmpA family protein [Bacteroidia bacterium]